MKKKIRDLPLKERVRLYNEAMSLRKKCGWGYVRIGRELSIPIDVVRHWIHHGRNPLHHGKVHFFKAKTSPELAYVIGVCQGDADLPVKGNVYDRTGTYIRLRANDRDFVEKFATDIATLLGKNRPYRIGFEKGQYRLCMHSFYLHEFLKKPFKELQPFIEAYPAEFIRGLVDSEGSVQVNVWKWKDWKTLLVKITISNTNSELLQYLQILLSKHFNISSTIRSSHKAGSKYRYGDKEFTRTKDAYDLIIGRLGDVKSFASSIGFSIAKKQQKLIDAIDIIENYSKGPEKTAAWFKFYQKENNRWVRINS